MIACSGKLNKQWPQAGITIMAISLLGPDLPADKQIGDVTLGLYAGGVAGWKLVLPVQPSLVGGTFGARGLAKAAGAWYTGGIQLKNETAVRPVSETTDRTIPRHLSQPGVRLRRIVSSRDASAATS